MKTIKLAVASALLSTSLISGPAFANQSPWVPPQTDAYSTPQEVCDAQLPPNPNSGFLSEVQNEDTDTVSGPDIVDEDPYQQIGTGTPTVIGLTLGTGYHRNGGSPNIWTDGIGDQLVYPNSDLYYHTHHTETTTTTFDCVPYKEVGQERIIDPDGLSSTGNSMVTDVQENVAGADFIDHNGGPFVDPNQSGFPVNNILICISPNNVTKGKPGTWTGKHGFLAANCPAAAASPTVSTWVPSLNAPDVYVP